MLTDRFVRIPGHFVCFEYEHVHERGLSVVKVTHNRDIAYHFREGGQAQEEAKVVMSMRGGKVWICLCARFVKPRLRHVLLFYRPFPHLDRCNNGF